MSFQTLYNSDGSAIVDANRLMRSGDFRGALSAYQRLINDGYPLAATLRTNIELCVRRLTSKGNADAEVGLSAFQVGADLPEAVICMTTIDSRLVHLGQVIESLHKQECAPVQIRLYISTEPYLLDKGIQADNPYLLELMKFPLLSVKWVPNTGPYRKIFPFLEEHFSYSMTHDKIFVTVDDDTIYPPDFLRGLLEQFRLNDCVVAYRGREMTFVQGRIESYANWGLGLPQTSLANLPTGKDGVLYSTRFFTRDFLRMEDALALAPTADDLWIKWHCALNGVPSLILSPEACTSDYVSFPVVDYSKEYRGNSLYAIYNASSAHGKNDDSVLKLESYYQGLYSYGLSTLINRISGA
jgi:hypothetical protein